MASVRHTPTRYLATSAFLNIGFADEFLKHIFTRDNRAKGPPCGLDVNLIAEWCFAAKRMNRSRTFIRIGLFVLAISTLIVSPRLSILFLLAVAIQSCVFNYNIKHGKFARALLSDDSKPPVNANIPIDAAAQLGKIQHEHDSSTIIYSGFSPFLGGGIESLGWNFALNIRPKNGSHEAPILRFTPDELHRDIIDGIEMLEIPFYKADEILCVPGDSIRQFPEFFHSREPDFGITPSEFDESILADMPARKYYRMQVDAWQGHLIISYYFRTTFKSDTLFVEAASYQALPIAKKYRLLDGLNINPKAIDIYRLVILSLLTVPFFLIRDIAVCLEPVFRILSDPRRIFARESIYETPNAINKKIDNDPWYDFGAAKAIREYYSSNSYETYFQKQDAVFYIKMLDARLLDMLIKFLDERNIDTSDLRDQKSTIINSGIIVSGSGSVTAGAVALGKKAKVSTKQVQVSSKN